MSERVPVPETRSDWALRRLRTAILTGEFPPGTKLRAEELAERWQVSPTPLREAFQRLGGSRLVEVSPQRGVRVAEFTLGDAADLLKPVPGNASTMHFTYEDGVFTLQEIFTRDSGLLRQAQ